jgi:hypothetical protein
MASILITVTAQGDVDEVRQRAVIALRARLAARQPEHTGVKKTSGAIEGGL